jgi:hypothetical protein
VRREQLDLVDSILGCADAAFTTMRSYDGDHPAVKRTLERLFERLSDYFENHGDLVIGLEPTAVVLGEKIVQQSESPAQNAWSAFYASGIRELTFKESLSLPDISKILEIGNRFRGIREEDFTEDDAVTALWELNLRGLEWVAAPCYGEDPDKSPDRVNEVDAQSAAALQAITPQTVTGTRVLEERERRRLIALLHEDKDAGLRHVEALLMALSDTPEGPIRGRLCEWVANALGAAVSLKKYGLALRIAQHLESREELLKRALDGGVVDALLAAFADADDVAAHQIEFLLRRCRQHARGVIEASMAMPLEKRQKLLACVVDYGEPTAVCVRDMLHRAHGDQAEALIAVVSQIPGAASREALLVATEHEFFRVRGLAYQALLDDPSVLPDRDLIMRILSDDHSLVRQCAFEYLAETRRPEARQWLQSQAGTFEFKNYEPAEQKRLYSTLVAVAGDALVPWLEAKLSKSHFTFFNSSDDERLCAISALAELRSTASRPVLEWVAGSWLVSGRTREAAKKALEMLEKPAEQRTARRRTFQTQPIYPVDESIPPVAIALERPPVLEAGVPAIPPIVAGADFERPLHQDVVEASRRETRARSTRETEAPPVEARPVEDPRGLRRAGDTGDTGYSFVASRKSQRSRSRRPTEMEPEAAPPRAQGKRANRRRQSGEGEPHE